MKRVPFVLAALAVSAPVHAADVVANAVSQNITPPLHNGGVACPANVAVLSDGDFSLPGYCPLLPVPAGYTISFDFSPAANERTTGLRLWSNAGSNYADAELRVFDVEVDYLDASGSPQTMVLNDVDIGDTSSVSDAKFVSFTGVDPAGLRGVTRFRLSDLRGHSGDARVEFREVNAVVVTPPTVTIAGATSGAGVPFTITATFSEDVTGVDLGDFVLTNATASNLVEVSPSVYTFTATPTPGSRDVTVSLPAGRAIDLEEGTPNLASDAVGMSVIAAFAPTEEVAFIDTIRREELKTLRQSLGRAQDISRGARDRLTLAIRCRDIEDREDATPEEFLECDRYLADLNRPLAVTGQATAREGGIMVNGMVAKMQANADGTKRRLFFGAFDVTEDSDLGTIATFAGHVAWERLTSRNGLWGYFIGAEASISDVRGDFTGDRQRLGVSGGVYGAQSLRNGLVADGFAVLGYGLNTLDLTDGTLDVETDYAAPSLLFGGALSGEREYERFTLHPELALAVGYTDIGNVDYDAGSGSATADAGHVALARLSLTPEIRMPWTPGHAMYDIGSFDVEPSVICEWVDAGARTGDCGAGLGFELTAQSTSGLHELSASLSLENVGGTTRTSLGLMIESRF